MEHSPPHPQETTQRWNLLFIVVLVVAAILIVITVLRPTNGQGDLKTAAPSETGTARNDIVTDDGQGAVEVSAQLNRERSTSDRIVLTLSLNTHSVDLSSFDPIAQVRLKADSQEIQGSLAQDPGTQSSHHKQFVLSFARPGTSQVILLVRNVAGVPERQLSFTLSP